MKKIRCLFVVLGLLYGSVALGGSIVVCYGYGCKKTAMVKVSDEQNNILASFFEKVENAELERDAIGFAVQKLYAISGEQTPIYQDKGGNFRDGPHPGRMDCVDHSETDTQFMNYLTKLGLIRYHKVVKPYYRAPIFFNLHYASRIEELETKRQWIVDSWFYDFGAQPVIMDAQEWRKGWYPEGW